MHRHVGLEHVSFIMKATFGESAPPPPRYNVELGDVQARRRPGPHDEAKVNIVPGGRGAQSPNVDTKAMIGNPPSTLFKFYLEKVFE